MYYFVTTAGSREKVVTTPMRLHTLVVVRDLTMLQMGYWIAGSVSEKIYQTASFSRSYRSR